MNVNHVYRIGPQGWQFVQGQEWVDVPAWPKLSHPALVVLDTDDVPSEVWRFEGKPEYATALIEKRVRTEGLVEGAAHIVVHRLIKSPSGFQVFFSAVAIDVWQRLSGWASQQADHCILMTAAGLLCSGIKAGQGRVLVSERHLSLFMQTDAAMSFFSAHALGRGGGAVVGAAQLLGANARGALSMGSKLRLELGGLWGLASETDWVEVADAFAQASDTTPVLMPTAAYTGGGGQVNSVLPALAATAALTQALNPGIDRFAWRAESWVGRITTVTAVVAIGLVGLGIFSSQQAQQQRQAAAGAQKALQELEVRIQAVNKLDASQRLVPVAEFAQRLDSGVRYDPIELLNTLKTHAGQDIRIQRVRLEPGQQGKPKIYRVDGVAPLDASGAVVRFVNALQAAGWSLKAVDPTDSAPGAFSYELVASVAPANS